MFNNVTGGDLSLAEFVETGDHETLAYLTAFGLGDDSLSSQTLVEIGSGIGRMTSSFTRLFAAVIACDLDAAFLERCRETVAQFGRPERLQHQSGRRWAHDRRARRTPPIWRSATSRSSTAITTMRWRCRDEAVRVVRPRRPRRAELPHLDRPRRGVVARRQDRAWPVAGAQARTVHRQTSLDRPSRLAGQPAVADRGVGGRSGRRLERRDRSCDRRSAAAFAIPGTSDEIFEGVNRSHWWLVATVRLSLIARIFPGVGRAAALASWP